MFCYRKNSADVQPVSCLSVIISCVVIILGLIWRKINLYGDVEHGDAAAPGRQLGRRRALRWARPRARAPAARSICGSAPAVPEGAEGFTTVRRGVLSSVYPPFARKHRSSSVLGQPSALVRVPCSPRTVEFYSFVLVVCIVAVNYCNAKLFCTGTYRYRT